MNRMGRSAALSLIFLLSAPVWVQSTARAEVIITEILANPETGTEWVELATTGEETVNISNFTLYDTVSSPSLILTFPEPTQLLPNTAHVFEIASSKLNNSGDTLNLFNTENEAVLSVSFSSSTKGLSWQRSFDLNEYFELTPTPGSFLTLPTPAPTPSPSETPDNSPSPQVASPHPNPLPSTPPSNKDNETSQPPDQTTAELTTLENEITTLVQTYTIPNYIFRTLKPQSDALSTPSAKTISIEKHFSPPNLSAISVMVGGILISSGSYLYLYVFEQKKEMD
jgi:hypothetical protein